MNPGGRPRRHGAGRIVNAMMANLSDQQLRQLIDHGEADRVEFKERLAGSAPDAIREAICSFANDLRVMVSRASLSSVCGIATVPLSALRLRTRCSGSWRI